MNDKVLNIIATELQNDEDGATKIKQIIVQNLFDFVRHEDKESRRRIGVETKSSSNENLDVVAFNGGGKAYVNDGICSSLIQRFISKILGLCFDPNHTFALISVQFCKLVFTLGYENPKLCISTFIGLEASESSIIRNKAHGVLRDLFNKHESLFDSSYSEGFKYAVEYRSSIADGLSTSRYYISILYSVVSKTVSARRKFITAINKSLQNYSSLDKQDHSQEFGRNFIYFMLQNLASVSFLTLEETYMIAETINNILSHQGLDLYDKVKALEENKSKKVVCIQSQAMICFLEFNSFLISKYGLNVERIANFKLERIDTELRSHPKVQRELVFDLDASDMKADLEEMSTVEAILGKFVSSMHFYNNN
ncbi:hypothetical protein CANTEDRAFT_117905 [Yamadazyma tenuis ATCC 10573]|uniref:Sister chromatid cohesion protein n=2 Tax=Candida tenuis TaxID=2315449 RepID=G3AX73_CANTC|nr:uncharacterized protein CANTEDRAFT_117905 [Yamadazyma tenuis ATCC 10573]EGV66706.1 hypothetical protein CANTEDRAFT_117905 [Yamadazyma tenuis ATCC 10573]